MEANISHNGDKGVTNCIMDPYVFIAMDEVNARNEYP
jgi:hypothetical protein